MLASEAPRLWLGAPLARIFVSWICSASPIISSSPIGFATFVPIKVPDEHSPPRAFRQRGIILPSPPISLRILLLMTQSEFAYLKLLREKYNKQAIMEISLKNLKLVKLKKSPSIKKQRKHNLFQSVQ